MSLENYNIKKILTRTNQSKGYKLNNFGTND